MDTKYCIIIVKNIIRIVENGYVDSAIEWDLIKTYEFFIFVLFKMGLYDENTDQIMYLQALKVGITF